MARARRASDGQRRVVADPPVARELEPRREHDVLGVQSGPERGLAGESPQVPRRGVETAQVQVDPDGGETGHRPAAGAVVRQAACGDLVAHREQRLDGHRRDDVVRDRAVLARVRLLSELGHLDRLARPVLGDEGARPGEERERPRHLHAVVRLEPCEPQLQVIAHPVDGDESLGGGLGRLHGPLVRRGRVGLARRLVERGPRVVQRPAQRVGESETAQREPFRVRLDRVPTELSGPRELQERAARVAGEHLRRADLEVREPQRPVGPLVPLGVDAREALQETLGADRCCRHVPAEAERDHLGDGEEVELLRAQGARLVGVDEGFEGAVGQGEERRHRMHDAEREVPVEHR